jgi:O-antigen/teichoic acid export membrane protein
MLRRLAKDLAVYGAGDFVLKFLGFAVFPIYANVFTVAEFGVLALVAVGAGLVSLVVGVGLNNAVQRFYWDPSTEEEDRPALVSSGLVVLFLGSTIGVGIALTLLYPARAALEGRYDVAWTIAVLALVTIVPAQILQYALDTLRLHFAKGRYLLVSFLKNLLGVLIGLVLILGLGHGLEGFFWGNLWGALVALPLALVLIRRDLTRSVRLVFARQLVVFGHPFIFAGLAYWVFSSVDRWMLAELSDNTNVGLYSIAFKFATLIVFVTTAFGQAWSPMAVQLMRDDPHYRTTYSRLLTVWFFMLALLGSAVSLFAIEILVLTTPSEYWSAALVMGVVVMGMVVSGTTQITAIGISLARRTSLLSTAAWITAAVNVLLNWLLIPRFGALGAGFATLASFGVLSGLYLYWTQRLHPIPLERAKLLYCAAITIGVVPIAYLFTIHGASLNAVLVKLALLALFLAGGVRLGIVDLPALYGMLRLRAARSRGWRG